MQEEDPSASLLTLLLVLLFALWKQRMDIRLYGRPDRSERRWSYFFVVIATPVFIGLFLLSSQLYLLISLLLFAACYVIGFGTGAHGRYRQIRDGAFIGWIISLPICFALWMTR